jgi:Zn-dependent peptidase ImmA (M78 family)
MNDEKFMDAEANAFAMELLMPADWLRADIEKMGGIDIEDDVKLNGLAKKYRVSPQVMAFRIGELRS